jgi:hypothetical protein
MDLSLQDLLQYTDEGEDMLNRIVTGGRIMGATLPTQIKACFNETEPSYWQTFSDDEEVETEVWKWFRQQSKDFYAVSFEALVKQWDKCMNVG